MSQTYMYKVESEPGESSVCCLSDDIVTQSALSEIYSGGGCGSESKIKCEVEEFTDNKSTACSETSALRAADTSHQLIDSTKLRESVKLEFSQETSSDSSDHSSNEISEDEISIDISSTQGHMKGESNCKLIFQQHEEEAVKDVTSTSQSSDDTAECNRCPVCKKIFYNFQDLKQHVQYEHLSERQHDHTSCAEKSSDGESKVTRDLRIRDCSVVLRRVDSSSSLKTGKSEIRKLESVFPARSANMSIISQVMRERSEQYLTNLLEKEKDEQDVVKGRSNSGTFSIASSKPISQKKLSNARKVIEDFSLGPSSWAALSDVTPCTAAIETRKNKAHRVSAPVSVQGVDSEGMRILASDTKFDGVTPGSTSLKTNKNKSLSKSVRPSNVIDETIVINVERISYRTKRARNKRACCPICTELVLQLPRHLTRHHADNMNVASALAKSGKDRKQALESLRNEGSFNHNCKVLKEGTGTLLVTRRPGNMEYAADDFMPCSYCYGLYVVSNLSRHTQTCSQNPTATKNTIVAPLSNQPRCVTSAEKYRLLLKRATCENDGSKFSEFKNKILNKMRLDSISTIVKCDTMILKYGQTVFKKSGSNRQSNIRQNLRKLGRLVIQLGKGSNEQIQLNEYICGARFDEIVRAVEILVQKGENSKGDLIVKNPLLALSLGLSIKKCALIKRSIGCRENDRHMKKDADAFLKLFNAEWTDRISSVSHNSLRAKRRNSAKEELPILSD